MKCRKAYAIIPVGENDRSAHVAQQKAPEVATPGLFSFTADTGTYRLCADKVVCKRVYEVERILLN